MRCEIIFGILLKNREIDTYGHRYKNSLPMRGKEHLLHQTEDELLQMLDDGDTETVL